MTQPQAGITQSTSWCFSAGCEDNILIIILPTEDTFDDITHIYLCFRTLWVPHT